MQLPWRSNVILDRNSFWHRIKIFRQKTCVACKLKNLTKQKWSQPKQQIEILNSWTIKKIKTRPDITHTFAQEMK